MLEHWNPTKQELEDWFGRKFHEFMVQEKRNSRILGIRWAYKRSEAKVSFSIVRQEGT